MKGVDTPHKLLYGYAVFFGFFMLVIGIGGGEYINPAFNFTVNAPPSGNNTLGWIFDNWGTFFSMMLANPFHPDVILLSFIVLVPFIVVMLYIIIQLIVDIIPF